MKKERKLTIAIDSHHAECGDGCCTEWWDTLTINGVELDRKFSQLCAESIEAVLDHLKIDHEFIHDGERMELF